MSDWRTARAPYATRSRLPEDDLPEIDWGAASFAPGGGDEPEPEPMPDPSEEERAMARLRARIAERDAAEGLMDPWAQEQAAPMGPQTSPPLPGSPAPLRAPRGGRTMAGSGLSVGMPEMLPAAPPAAPMTPQQSAQQAYRQPALDAVRAGVGAVTPPVDPMAPPPTPTAPDAVPQATTNPDAPTVTAGSQAAGLAQRPAAPQSPTTDPTGAPQFAMGATGLGGPQAGMSERVQAGVGGGVFDRQVGAARGEDARRDRLRRILTGIGAMLALRSGNAGFMVPAAIAGGLVRRPDEEATLRANDERAQAVGGAQAEQRALLEQLAMRREAQQATERQGQQTLALRAAELQGTQEDRALRTSIELAQEQRAAGQIDPDSPQSQQERDALNLALSLQPREVQQAFAQRGTAGLSAVQLESLREQMEQGGRARTMAGGLGRGRGESAPGGGGTGPRPGQITNAAPRSYLLTIINRIGNGTQEAGTYETPSPYAIALANSEWLAKSQAERDEHIRQARDTMGQDQAGRQVPGFTAADNVAESDASKARDIHAAARRLTSALATMIAISDDSSVWDRARAGANMGEDAARYRTARQSVITAIRTVRGLGTPQGQELAQLEAEIESMASLDQLLNGTAGLRAARNQFANDALITMESLGYRAPEGTNPLLMGPMRAEGTPTTTADAPPAPEREHTITIRFTRNGETRSRTVPISEADRWRAQGVAAGWTVVQ